MAELPVPSDPDPPPLTRWELIRDVAAFQVKLGLDALRDLVLSPVSLVAGLIDLLAGGETTGRRFHDVLRTGRRTERWINLFGRIDDDQTVDALVKQVEKKLAEQVERGGVTASAKGAIDRSLDAVSRGRSPKNSGG